MLTANDQTPPPFQFSSERKTLPQRSSAAKTPRFIFASPLPSSSNPRFASTPRFVLPQPSRVGESVDDDIHGSDDEPSSNLSPALRVKDKEPRLSKREEVIEDVEEEGTLSSGLGEDYDNAGDACNETEDVEKFDIDAELEILFPTTPSRRKRRRISPSPLEHPIGRRTDEVDQLSSGSSDVPQPPSPIPVVDNPLPSEGLTHHKQPSLITYKATSTPQPAATPTASKQSHQSINRPQFVFPIQAPFNSSQYLSNDITSSTSSTAAAMTSTSRSHRSKPHFILPRSPSPTPGISNISPPSNIIPDPFSPSRCCNRRDTQLRGNGTGFVSRGMAVEARGWILEMAAKAQNNSKKSSNGSLNPCPGRHLLTAELSNVRGGDGYGHGSAYLGGGNRGSGNPTTITVAQSRCQPPKQLCAGDSQVSGVEIAARNLLLLGPPCTAPTPTSPSTAQVVEGNKTRQYRKIKKGDAVGVREGFTWGIELGCRNGDNAHRNQGEISLIANSKAKEEMGIRKGHARGQRKTERERWLVAVEWDILRHIC